jgi:hypothetical protein
MFEYFIFCFAYISLNPYPVASPTTHPSPHPSPIRKPKGSYACPPGYLSKMYHEIVAAYLHFFVPHVAGGGGNFESGGGGNVVWGGMEVRGGRKGALGQPTVEASSILNCTYVVIPTSFLLLILSIFFSFC